MIFEVTPDQIEKLSDSDLRTLVGHLAEQEALRHGLSTAGVTYGGHQNAGDGGIDVDVDVKGAEIDGYVPRALTGFQVKAEDMARADILKEMRPGNKLRSSIRELGEKGGAYIIVSSRGSVSKTALSKRRNAMAEAIGDVPGASAVHLDFYDRRRVASWVNRHPGLIPWVRSRVGQPLTGWRAFEDWSSSPGSADEPYLADDSVRLVGVRLKNDAGQSVVVGINRLREILTEPRGVVRLVGLSGVGKTRLAQALFDSGIGEKALTPQLAIYTDLSNEPDPVPLELLDHLHHLRHRCILLVDNCGVDLHRKLVARMKNVDSAVSLITIEYDISDDEPENTDVFKLEPASSAIIEKIVERRYPKLTSPEVQKIAEFSEGNSRIALALADTAKDGESLADLKDSELFKRLFRQRHEDNPALLRAAKACSLVYSFDGETLEGDDAELSILASLAGQTVSEFHAHVAELHRRQLVQKRANWRALLPHALAHRLAKQALQDIPKATLRTHFTELAPERLILSFSRRLGCLHDSSEAQAIVADWLGEEGWIAKVESLNRLGITVLDNVAPVNPGAVLHAIREAAKRDARFFDDGADHRSKTISILRSLAYEPAVFDEAIDLIRRFAHAVDTSNNSAEAINIFKSLFFLYLSGTHASAEQRAKFLERMARSEDPRDHALFQSGLDAMLECSHFSSSYSFEFGARRRDFGYRPRTNAGVWDWYRIGISLCSTLTKANVHRTEIRKLIAGQIRFLIPNTGVVEEFIALADEFAQDEGWPEGWAGVRGAARTLRKAKRSDDAKKLNALAERLKPRSLADRIASYVAPDRWSALDIAEMDIEDEEKYEKAQKQVETKCRDVGKELATNLKALATCLPKILTAKGNRSGIVAEEIGRETPDVAAAWAVITAEILSPKHNGQTSGFPSMFLAGLAENRRGETEKLLDAALADERLHPFFVHMQAVVGVDERGSERLLKAVTLPSVPTYTFANLAWGRPCDKLSGQNFHRLLLAIGERSDGLDVALDILHMRVFSRKADKQAIGPEEKETGRELLGKLTFEKKRQNDDHNLSKIVAACLTNPGDEIIAKRVCTRLREAIAEHRAYAWDYTELVTSLAAAFPRSVLEVFVETEKFGYESRRGVFGMFRDHRPCPLRKIDCESAWNIDPV